MGIFILFSKILWRIGKTLLRIMGSSENSGFRAFSFTWKFQKKAPDPETICKIPVDKIRIRGYYILRLVQQPGWLSHKSCGFSG
jgi:hypothetical protein